MPAVEAMASLAIGAFLGCLGPVTGLLLTLHPVRVRAKPRRKARNDWLILDIY